MKLDVYYNWDSPITKKDDSVIVSDDLQYHLDNKLPLGKSVYRYGSNKFSSLVNELKHLVSEEKIFVNENDLFLIREYSNEKVIVENDGEILLNFVYECNELNEAEYKGKQVQLNKPKRGGSKKFFVYVKDPKTNKIKKVSFGAKSGGGKLSVKIKDPEARKRFADRHNCDDKKDRTKPGYWSCNLPRYAHLLNLSSGGNFYW